MMKILYSKANSSVVYISKKDVTWFAFGILLGILVTVVGCFQTMMIGLPSSSSSGSRSEVAPISIVPDEEQHTEAKGSSLLQVMIHKPMLMKTTTRTGQAMTRNNNPVPVVSVSSSSALDLNSTESFPISIAKIAIAEICFHLVIRAVRIPFRILSHVARRANFGRRLATILHGTKLAKRWQTLIQLYYKTSISKLVNRSKRFVKMVMHHHHHHAQDSTTSTTNDHDDSHNGQKQHSSHH